MNATLSIACGGTGVFALAAALEGQPASGVVRAAVAGGALAAAAVTDIRERRVPNRIILPAAAICVAIDASAGIGWWRAATVPLLLVGALLLLSALCPASLGMGDVKAALVIALALGHAATAALILAVVLAALTALGFVLREGAPAVSRTMPLAPFLATGALVALALT